MSGPTSAPLPVPGRALAVGAHPDDVELSAGATLATWAAAGCEVSIVVCTDGSKGSWDVEANTEQLVVTRREEARAAATALGATGEVVFLAVTDGELSNDLDVRAELARTIRRLKPDVLLGHDPWKRYRLHPDHRAAGYLTCDALVAARDPHFFPRQGIPHHRPSALLLFEAEDPDHAEPVTERAVAAKIAALDAHRSQWESTMAVRADPTAGGTERDRFTAAVVRDLEAVGRWAGIPLAERFRFVPTDR